jgi:hypothetical protein
MNGLQAWYSACLPEPRSTNGNLVTTVDIREPRGVSFAGCVSQTRKKFRSSTCSSRCRSRYQYPWSMLGNWEAWELGSGVAKDMMWQQHCISCDIGRFPNQTLPGGCSRCSAVDGEATRIATTVRPHGCKNRSSELVRL